MPTKSRPADRSASSQSLKRDGEKASATRLHKPHTYGRHTVRAASGKGLNKLARRGSGGQLLDDIIAGAADPPGTSWTRRTKGSMRKNVSQGTLSRNPSAIKRVAGSFKREPKSIQFEIGDEDGRNTKKPVRFEIGDEHDGDWTEESASQSPATTRSNSRPKTPQDSTSSPPVQPPDAEAVTNRLLRRSESRASAPRTSAVNVSPLQNGSVASTYGNDSSMPGDGISRFLSNTSQPGTPGSISHLQQNLANLTRQRISPRKNDARRVQSATNLRPDHEDPPPKQTMSPVAAKYASPFESARGLNPQAGKSLTQLKVNLDREAAARGPPVSSHPLLLHEGSMLNMAGAISTTPAEVERRVKRQYQQSRKGLEACRKYYEDLILARLPPSTLENCERQKKERQKRPRTKPMTLDKSSGSSSVKRSKTTPGSSQSKGRVRFDMSGKGIEEGQESPGAEDDITSLLKRMWASVSSVET